ncbi:MAG TPA: ABC transporter permease [Chitinophagales bacterium]|nr:ABC transporter permease [Chitinophagales bacterium]HRK25900.1 ABC transporter permease [Chitinophagales bacterium]
MSLLDNILLALNAIRANLLRTILTCMIIAFGIMALVGILTAVDGIQASLSSNFATMGANNFDIRKKGTGIQVGRRGKRPKDYQPISITQALEFKERFNYPVTASISVGAAFAATVKYQSIKTNPNITVRGGDANYLSVAGLSLVEGRNFTDQEVASGKNLIILGNGMANKLFKKPQLAIDKVVSVDNKKYRVVGVLEEKGSSSIFSSDNLVIVPLMNARQEYANAQTTYVITVSVNNAYQIEEAIAEATGLMRSIRKLYFSEEDDFDISKSDKLASILIEQSEYVTTAATVIGIITLLGGAIGLMNIMLVSVAERIREIGISKALGATRQTVVTQFLVEAIVICQIGGILGVILGIAAGNGVSILIKGPFIIPWLWIVGGIAICFVVGIVSGLYPAIKASNVDPIEALRYE